MAVDALHLIALGGPSPHSSRSANEEDGASRHSVPHPHFLPYMNIADISNGSQSSSDLLVIGRCCSSCQHRIIAHLKRYQAAL